MKKKTNMENLGKEFSTNSAFFNSSSAPPKWEPVTIKLKKLQIEEPTNVPTEEQSIKATELPSEGDLKLRLQLYTFNATKDAIKKGRFTATNVELSDEMKRAIKELTEIFDRYVPNETDKTLKDVVNNALYEYLTKQYKRLQNI